MCRPHAWLPDSSVVTGMENVYVLKQLSSSNWQFERDYCEDVLRQRFTEEFELEVRDYPAGKKNKNRGSGHTFVAVFKKPPNNELIAEMRWSLHTRFD